MQQPLHVYTSITSNYLPKARVLAESVKQQASQTVFHLVLSDTPPIGFDLAEEPFDTLIESHHLVASGFPAWAFGHSVVELCTAVKGAALEYIFNEHAAEQVFFFDPDMVVFSRLDELSAALSEASVVLTPHQTDPEPNAIGIMDNEMSSLIHGVYNLGFVGVRNVSEGRRFARWWAERLHDYCHDDLPRGLFTDQKWVNLAPCFFEGVHILRSPGYNVATWNLSTRKATGSLEDGILINGEPLGFYHFSGFDSGDQMTMLERYGGHSPVLQALREWYIAQCEQHGQSALGKLPSKYDTFSNGEKITRGYRLLYRQREDLRSAFPNPYMVSGADSYKAWYDAHPAEHPATGDVTIAPGTSFSQVFLELGRYFNKLIVSGAVRGAFKRYTLKLGVYVMLGLAWIAGRGSLSR